MQKLVIGALALLLLFFAAADSRLLDRQRRLEEKIAELERQAKAKPAPKPASPAAPAPPPPSMPFRTSAPAGATRAAAPAATGSGPTTVVDKAQAYLSRTIEDLDGALSATVWKKWAPVFKTSPPAEELHLSDSQKHVIDGLRKSRDLQTQVFRDQIQKIEEQTELAIRQLLDAEQLKRYDAQTPTLEVYLDQLTVRPQTSEAPAVANPAYLGIQASDAEGGGARITEVLHDSAARLFGLQPDDVVLEFDRQKIGNFAQLAEQIRATPAGTYVTLRINRGGAVFNQGVELGGRPK